MKQCRFYHEEFPILISETNSGIEIEMNPVCKRLNLVALGYAEDSLPCGGNPENCPFINHH